MFHSRHVMFRSMAGLIAGAAVATLAAGCATTPDAEPAYAYPAAGEDWLRVDDPRRLGYCPQCVDRATEMLKDLDTTSMMIIVDGQTLLEYGDVSAISYLASVRKSILAMLYGNYVADGSIRLDATLEELDIDDHKGLTDAERQATVRHLITARSGVYHPASNPGDNLADAPERGSKKPGEYYLYSNWDFNAAGAIFEQEVGVDIYDALKADLAEPLGMQDFDRSIHVKSGDLERSMYPAYHMRLSTRDKARIAYLMLREGRWEDEQIIPRDWVHEMTDLITPRSEMNPESRRQREFGYGYMWWIFDEQEPGSPFDGAYMGSGAYGQYVLVIPRLNLVAVHKTDPDDGRTGRQDFLDVVREVIGGRHEPIDDEAPVIVREP